MTVENHGLRFEGIPHRILQENRPRSPNFPQIQPQQFQQMLLPVNRFRIFHGRLSSVISMPNGKPSSAWAGLKPIASANSASAAADCRQMRATEIIQPLEIVQP